jgi:hypothetical protein
LRHRQLNNSRFFEVWLHLWTLCSSLSFLFPPVVTLQCKNIGYHTLILDSWRTV